MIITLIVMESIFAVMASWAIFRKEAVYFQPNTKDKKEGDYQQ